MTVKLHREEANQEIKSQNRELNNLQRKLAHCNTEVGYQKRMYWEQKTITTFWKMLTALAITLMVLSWGVSIYFAVS